MPDEQGWGCALLFLVRRGDSGISPDPTLWIALDQLHEQILGAKELIDNIALASYLGDRQFEYGGIAKAPGEHTVVRYC